MWSQMFYSSKCTIHTIINCDLPDYLEGVIEASDIVINNNIMIIMLVQKVTPEAINDDMVHNLAHMQQSTDALI